MPYKNSEKRKEKSRDAARFRRSKESEVFFDLANVLPMTPQATAQLDKASIMRIAIAHLKLQSLMPEKENLSSSEEKMDALYTKALEGFFLIISKDGDMVFTSDDVHKYLGLNQLDLVGHSVYDFTHPCDHDEIREVVAPRGEEEEEEFKQFFMRMKCTLTNKGRNINLKSATYKVLKCTGRQIEVPDKNGLREEPLSVCMLVAEPIPHPANIEIPLDCNTFLSRHSMSMKFTYCDDRIKDLLGYETDDLIGRSVYEFHHALDSEDVVKSYKTLFSKSQTVTGRYRFLAKHGGYAWVETQGTVIYNSRTDKPQCVVCLNYVITGIEEADVIMSDAQMEEQKNKKCIEPVKPKEEPIVKPSVEELDVLGSRAPAAGQVLVNLTLPLEPVDGNRIASLYNNMFMGTEVDDANQEMPFMVTLKDAHRDQLSVPSPDSTTKMPSSALSPAKTPDHSSSDEPATVFNFGELNEEIDFDLRAPYIPMSDDDDLIFSATPTPIITIDDSGPREMLGITETVFAPFPHTGETSKEEKASTPLAILKLQSLRTPPAKTSYVERNSGPPKMKRPMETNRLEKGPPVKVLRTVASSTVTSAPAKATSTKTTVPKPVGHQQVTSSTKQSVLMNLLLNGEDSSNGYVVQKTQENTESPQVKQVPQVTSPSRLVPSGLSRLNQSNLRTLISPESSLFKDLFPYSITQRDAEVNAPVANQVRLLQGADILIALEQSALNSQAHTLLNQ